MNTPLTKTLVTAAAFAALALAPPREAGAQPPCVDNALAHSVGVSPTTASPWYHPSLTLPGGTSYRYTYHTSGTIPIQNFRMTLNGLSWLPFSSRFVGASPNTLTFQWFVPPSAQPPVCSSKTVHVRFEKPLWSTSFWTTVCNFDLNVVVVEPGGRRNLTFVKGVSRAYYAGSDHKAHSLTWNPSTQAWDYAPVNVVNWGAVQMDGEMASFDDGSRIFFKGKDQRLYNLVRNSSGSAWTLSPVMPGLPLVAGDVAARGSDEVVFVGADNKVHQLTLIGGGFWTDQVVPTGGGAPDGGSLSLPPGSTHIFFAQSARLFAVHRVGGAWVTEQISPPTAATPWQYWYEGDVLAAESGAVYYKGRDYRIHRYTKSGAAWTLDPMPVSAASENNVILGYTGFLAKFPGEDRVFYKAATGRIYNVYRQNGAWHNYSLRDHVTSTAGDLVAAEEKIFYINHDRRVHNFYWGDNAWWDVPLSSASQADARGCITAYYDP